MLGVLLESKARRQRRAAGATLSVALHVAIIGAAVAGTVQGKPAPPEKPAAVFVQIAPPKPSVTRDPVHSAPTNAMPRIPTDIVIRHIDAPTIVPKDLPPIDMTGSIAGDSVVIGGDRSGAAASFGDKYGDKYGAESASDNRDWDVHEILMHVLTPAKP